MKQSEAVRAVAMLAAYFPAKPLAQETAAVWAAALLPYEIADALRAVERIGTNARYLPPLVELVEAVKEAKSDRERAEIPQLPAGEERYVDFSAWLQTEATPAQRQAFARFHRGLSGQKEGQHDRT